MTSSSSLAAEVKRQRQHNSNKTTTTPRVTNETTRTRTTKALQALYSINFFNAHPSFSFNRGMVLVTRNDTAQDLARRLGRQHRDPEDNRLVFEKVGVTQEMIEEVKREMARPSTAVGVKGKVIQELREPIDDVDFNNDDNDSNTVAAAAAASTRHMAGLRMQYCTGLHRNLLSELPAHNGLEWIDVEERDFDDDSMAALALAMASCRPSLRSLRLCMYNNLATAWGELIDALIACGPSLRSFELDLYYCGSRLDASQVDAILTALDEHCHNLESLSLNNCDLSSTSMSRIVSMCRRGAGLKRLDLLHSIHDRDELLRLARELPSLTTLKHLHIDSRGVSAEVWREVAQAIAGAICDASGRPGNTSITNIRLYPEGDNRDIIQFYAALNKAGFRGLEENEMTPKKWFEALQVVQDPKMDEEDDCTPKKYVPLGRRVRRRTDAFHLDRVYYLLRYRPEWWSQHQG